MDFNSLEPAYPIDPALLAAIGDRMNDEDNEEGETGEEEELVQA